MSKNWGQFVGQVEAIWLTQDSPDRDMRLLKSFTFVDPGGKNWDAPSGSVINGASIPRPLWPFVGSPYIGEFRRASVVHDVACSTPKKPRKAADRMFYYACRTDGCSWAHAKVLYLGVRIGAWIAGDDSLRTVNEGGPSFGPMVVSTREEVMVIETYQRAYYLTEDLKGEGDDLDLIDQAVKTSAALTIANHKLDRRRAGAKAASK